MTRQRARYATLVILLFLTLVVLQLQQRPRELWLLDLPGLTKGRKVPPAKSRLVFPRSFPLRDLRLKDYVKVTKAFHVSGMKYTSIRKTYDKRATSPSKPRASFVKHDMLVFQSGLQIDGLSKCKTLSSNLTDVQVSRKKSLDTLQCAILRRFVDSIDRGDNDYLMEMLPYFGDQIRLQIRHDVCDLHWFRLAGSSVFLKEYGLHMMISRLAYSPDGSRNNPKFLFAFAQLYTKDWKEIEPTSLVIPTNAMDDVHFFKEGEQTYKVMDFPALLPVPFFHSYDNAELKYLGPEDPRVLLIKNKAGYEEPMIVFNAHHQKLGHIDDDEDEFLVQQLVFYRSMWMSFPFQFQKGKLNTDGWADEEFDNKVYNRVTELRIKNIPRQSKQKNWTPMLSEALRTEHGYDKNVQFVYRWANLQILNCDIETGKCGFLYHMNDNLRVSSKIGPLRGGTQLLNVNEIIKTQTKIPIEDIIPQGREIWVGFARAHLVKCGCANDFYRPNLVVILKDTVVSEDKTKDVYELSYVSPFISLNVDIISWDSLRPYELCRGTNALIPNGISSWMVSSALKGKEKWKIEDYLTLAISVSDSTVDKVDIKGLLSSLVNIQSDPLFIRPNSNITRVAGSNNDNLQCGMTWSKKFCSVYGKQKIDIEHVHKDLGDWEIELEDDYDKLEVYYTHLDMLGLDL